MKKLISSKKLSVNATTIKQLASDDIQDVGGARNHSKHYSHCGSCGIACTVIGCTR